MRKLSGVSFGNKASVADDAPDLCPEICGSGSKEKEKKEEGHTGEQLVTLFPYGVLSSAQKKG